MLYSAVVIWIAVKKPPALWQMAKIQMFVKFLGERGTVYFFYGLAIVVVILGICLFTL